jgi:hypothetical protein
MYRCKIVSNVLLDQDKRERLTDMVLTRAQRPAVA